MSYFDSRYLTLIGHVQSGKTNEEINYCYRSVHDYRVPVVFIVRNIKADQLQLRDRFSKSENEFINKIENKIATLLNININQIEPLKLNKYSLYKTCTIGSY